MQSVLITGTSKGIGYEMALTFARCGYQVHATMRNTEQCPTLPETIAREKLPITISTMDVNSDDSVRDAIRGIVVRHGPIDVLVNNAGIERFGSIEELSTEDFRASMETNYFGALRCIKAVITSMRERRRGTIINISSVAGTFCHPPATPYCASKWALEALSEGLACEMKTYGVRVAWSSLASSTPLWRDVSGRMSLRYTHTGLGSRLCSRANSRRLPYRQRLSRRKCWRSRRTRHGS